MNRSAAVIRWARRYVTSTAALGLLLAGLGAGPARPAPLLISRSGGGGGSPADGLMLDVPGDGLGFRNGPFGPLFDLTNMAPGDSFTLDVGTLNADGPDSRLSLRALDIVESELGCEVPEALVDATCGAGTGELGLDLRFDILGDFDDDGAAGDFEPVLLDASLADLAAETGLSDDELEAGEAWIFRITVRLPFTSGNETMSDRVDLDLRWSLSEADGEVIGTGDPSETGTAGDTGGPGADVLGAGESRDDSPASDSPGSTGSPAPPPAGDPGPPSAPETGVVALPSTAGDAEGQSGSLPFTGAAGVRETVLVASGLILAGIVNRRLGRRRRPAG